MSRAPNFKAAIQIVLVMGLCDLPIIMAPVFFYLKTHDYRLLFIPLPLALIVNIAVLYSRRKALLRTTGNA